MRNALVDRGWDCVRVFGRDDDVTNAASGVDVCIIATPDRSIRLVADEVRPADAVLVHLSGALGIDVLSPHRAGCVHPLVSLANPTIGAQQLATAWFAVAGDPLATTIADELSGRSFPLDDVDRALYHAAAVIASNHLVALLGQVETLADGLGIPFEVFMPLVRGSVDNVAKLGPQAALTGPAARGDMDTIETHRAALRAGHEGELAAYDALVALAMRLSERDITPEP